VTVAPDGEQVVAYTGCNLLFVGRFGVWSGTPCPALRAAWKSAWLGSKEFRPTRIRLGTSRPDTPRSNTSTKHDHDEDEQTAFWATDRR